MTAERAKAKYIRDVGKRNLDEGMLAADLAGERGGVGGALSSLEKIEDRRMVFFLGYDGGRLPVLCRREDSAG